MKDKKIRCELRRERTRDRLGERPNARPRLCVHGSLRYFYAKVIDDTKGVTLASASSLSKEVRGEKQCFKNRKAAEAVGKLIAEKAIKAGVTEVVFDRGGRIYHGRLKALADAARAAGLKF